MSDQKFCSYCDSMEDTSHWNKNRKRCKPYCKTYNKTYYAENKEKFDISNKDYREAHRKETKAYYEANKEAFKERFVDYYAANKPAFKQRNKTYREVNSAKEKERLKTWRKNNRAQINQGVRHRYKTDLDFKLSKLLRSRLTQAVARFTKGKTVKKGGSAVRELGCPIEYLKEHLEKQFVDGMSWDNWSVDGWHIDHIVPIASFDLTDPQQIKKACHYTNLQPLWALDNQRKGDTISPIEEN